MKRPEICLLILVIIAAYSLATCAQRGSAFGRINCSSGGEVCITITAVEPINFGDPVRLIIKVSSSKDISDLEVSLYTWGGTVDGPQDWEKYLSSTYISPGFAFWTFAINAGQTLTFNRVVHYPNSEGYFNIGAEAVTFNRIYVGDDSFYIHMTHEGVNIYRSGTPIPPDTPNITVAAYGPGTPVPTFLYPSTTPEMPTSTPIPTQFIPYPIPYPYPSPSPYP
jgi:hypothetical protein